LLAGNSSFNQLLEWQVRIEDMGRRPHDASNSGMKGSSKTAKRRKVVDEVPDEQRCRRSDGRDWRCSKRVFQGSLCEYHYIQIRNRNKAYTKPKKPVVKTTISEENIKQNARKRVIANKESKSYNLSLSGKSQRRSTGRAAESDPEEFSADDSGNAKLQNGGNKVSFKEPLLNWIWQVFFILKLYVYCNFSTAKVGQVQ